CRAVTSCSPTTCSAWRRRCSPIGCCPASRPPWVAAPQPASWRASSGRCRFPRGPVREALAGLTVRGRAFLAAGITAAVCAILLGQPTLTRVGVLIAALPLLTALTLGRSRYRLALVRSVGPQTVTAGQPATVQLT